jgi:hypothetical protein
MLIVNFSPSISESLIASSDFAVRPKVSGVSMSRVVSAMAIKQGLGQDKFLPFVVASVYCEIFHKRQNP